MHFGATFRVVRSVEEQEQREATYLIDLLSGIACSLCVANAGEMSCALMFSEIRLPSGSDDGNVWLNTCTKLELHPYPSIFLHDYLLNQISMKPRLNIQSRQSLASHHPCKKSSIHPPKKIPVKMSPSLEISALHTDQSQNTI